MKYRVGQDDLRLSHSGQLWEHFPRSRKVEITGIVNAEQGIYNVHIWEQGERSAMSAYENDLCTTEEYLEDVRDEAGIIKQRLRFGDRLIAIPHHRERGFPKSKVWFQWASLTSLNTNKPPVWHEAIQWLIDQKLVRQVVSPMGDNKNRYEIVEVL